MNSRTMEQIRKGRSFSPDSFKDAKEAIFPPLWLPAYYPGQYAFLVAGVAIFAYLQTDGQLTWVNRSIIAGVIWYALSVFYVNRTAQPIMDAFQRDARANAQEILSFDGETETYTLRYKSGNLPFLSPPVSFDPTSLVVGEQSAAFHEDASLDMRQLDAYVGNDTTEIFYDQVVQVDYDSPTLEVTVSTGTTHQFPTTRKPDDALHALQQRIRAQKA